MLSDDFHYFRACCVTGAVYLDEGSTASFGGEMIFANNTAEENGGTAYECMYVYLLNCTQPRNLALSSECMYVCMYLLNCT